MKKRDFITLIVLVLLALPIYGQEIASVENRIIGVQTGAFGLWVYHEQKVFDKVALRSEFGLDGGFSVYGDNDVYVYSALGIAAEPRWYYSLNRRAHNGRRVKNNSANYASILTRFHPKSKVIDNQGSNAEIVPDLAIIPSWGIRRTFSERFNFEFAYGIGWQWTFLESGVQGGVIGNFTLRIGYDLLGAKRR
ncbi:MAG: hypothetical protein OCD76_12495 [Reichenbachiella sp.]